MYTNYLVLVPAISLLCLLPPLKHAGALEAEPLVTLGLCLINKKQI